MTGRKIKQERSVSVWGCHQGKVIVNQKHEGSAGVSFKVTCREMFLACPRRPG